MQRPILLLATLLAGFAVVAAFTTGDRGYAAQRTDELVLVLDVPGREPIQAQFVITAKNERDAMQTALNAALDLVPGATVTPLEAAHSHNDGEGRVTAQWAPWGWHWDADELPLPVVYNPEAAPAGFTPADVAAALAVWSNAPGSSFSFAYGGETSLTTSMDLTGPDGSNVIAWKDIPCDPGCVLGVTTKSFTTHEADIVLNANPKANLGDGSGDTVDSFSVLVHEAGHMLGLEHSCPIFGPCSDDEVDAVMYYAYGGSLRQLGADDIAGLSHLYPESPATGAIGGAVEVISVEVAAGWNLVASPTGRIENLAAGLSCVEVVYSLDSDGWATWVRGVPARLQTLNSIEPGTAVWVYSSDTCAATITP